MKRFVLVMSVVLMAGLSNADTITLSGAGKKATDLFHLDAGLVVFSTKISTPEDSESIRITLYDSNGKYVAEVFSGTIKNTALSESSKAMGITTSGNYILDVAAYDNKAEWEITVNSDSDIQTVNLNDTGFLLSGRGKTASGLFYLDAGLVVFSTKISTPEDSESIRITLYDSNGKYVAEVFSGTIKNTALSESSKAMGITTSGNYILDVAAYDNKAEWEISIRSPQVVNYCTEEKLQAERTKWDVGLDGKIGMPEAIRALQIEAGIRQE